MAASNPSPAVSVCIPTCQRPQYLRRAVESVFAQTFLDWELIVSDDEDPAGETWEYLQELARQDERVRITQNAAPHGAVANSNHAFRQASGAWVKPLHDDDALRPECLRTLLDAARGLPSVVMVSGLTANYLSGRPIAGLRRRGRSPLELIEQRYAHLGMYLQDCNVGLPSQVMVRREAIEKGAWYEDVPGIVLAFDTLWNCAVLRHGDVLFVNRVLVDYHQHDGTMTASRTDPQIEAEYPIVLARELDLIDPCLKPLSLDTVLGMANCIRAVHRWKKGRVMEGLRLLRQARRSASWMLAARWLLNQVIPGVLHMVPRIDVAAERPEPGGRLGKKRDSYLKETS